MILAEENIHSFTIKTLRENGFTVLSVSELKKGIKDEEIIQWALEKPDNEINFRMDFRVRDNFSSNSRLDQNSSFATNGSKEITISPTIDYYISNRVNLKFYFDQRRVNPYISSSAPTVDTRAGVQVRISRAQ